MQLEGAVIKTIMGAGWRRDCHPGGVGREMTHYIYSGYLRRKAREILARHSQSLAIAVVGVRALERTLFAKIAAATLVESLDSLDAEDIRRVASSDAILCRFDEIGRAHV